MPTFAQYSLLASLALSLAVSASASPPGKLDKPTLRAQRTLTIALSKDKVIRQQQLDQVQARLSGHSKPARLGTPEMSSSMYCDRLSEQASNCDPVNYDWIELTDTYDAYDRHYELRAKLDRVEIQGFCTVTVVGPYGTGSARCSEVEELSNRVGGSDVVGLVDALGTLTRVLSPKLPQCAKIPLVNKITVDQDATWDYQVAADAVKQ